MFRVAFAQLRRTVGRTLALLIAIVVATTSFTVLTGSVETDRLQVRGTATAAFRSNYDLLVRPGTSYTPRETGLGMVRPNYQSGVFGGITPAQLNSIASIDGVEVAAPVSNLGYVNLQGIVKVDLRPLLSGATQQLFRIRPTFTMDRGLSRFVGTPVYVYVSRNRATISTRPSRFGLPEDWGDNPTYTERVQGRSLLLAACSSYTQDWLDKLNEQDSSRGYSATPWGYKDPYAVTATQMRCYYLPTQATSAAGYGASDPDELVAEIPVSLPVLLTAVDPDAENRLSDLAGTVVSGRSLTEADGPPSDTPPTDADRATTIPVLAATRISIDQQVSTSVERIRAENAELTSALSPSSGLIDRLSRLDGTVVARSDAVSAQTTWAGLGKTAPDETGLDEASAADSNLDVGTYWQVGPSGYHDDGHDLDVLSVPNPAGAYVSPQRGEQAPVGSDDDGVRAVTGRSYRQGGFRLGRLKVVGRFDPAEITDENGLSGLTSQTYASPLLAGADQASRAALGDRPLAPSSNVAGYAAQPPALLTTLAAGRFLLNQTDYGDPERGPVVEGTEVGHDRADPISVIRVRVAGVSGPDPVSRERLNQAALAITRRTGLAVDIVAGASGAPTTVVLPAGEHGRPQLRLVEQWARKSSRLSGHLCGRPEESDPLHPDPHRLHAGGRECGQRCRSDPPGRSRGAVLPGLGRRQAVRGGAARAGGGRPGGRIARDGPGLGDRGDRRARCEAIPISPQRALLAVPPAVLLSMLAGLVPALRAARATPMDAVRPLVRLPRASGRVGRTQTVSRLAWVGLGRTPGRTALAAVSLAVGIAALTVLLTIQRVFHGLVVGTLLGDAVALQVRRPDIVALVAILILGAAAVADVLYLSVREQAGEFAVLRSGGWPESALARLVTVQGVGIGLLGSLAGGAVGVLAVLGLLGSVPIAVLGPVGIAVPCGLILASIASLVPALLVRRLPTARLLAEENT